MTQLDPRLADALETEALEADEPQGSSVVDAVEDLPRWFTISLAAAIVFVAAAGFSALTLLGFEIYHPALAIALGASAAVIVAVVVARRVERPTRAASGAAVAAIAIALAFFAFNASFHSEHVLTERDPAIYINTGREIARTHELHPQIQVAPFENANRFSMAVPSMGADAQGNLIYTFFPMLPALLALGDAVGGDTGMLLVGAVLGALALLVAYALAARVTGPRWALVVPVFLTVNPLPGWFARDAYSELVVGVVILGGVWLYLVARPARSITLSAVAGAVAATAFLARIDAIAIIAALVGFAGLEWIAGRDRDTAPDRRAVAAFGVSLLAVTYLSSLLANNSARGYINDLRGKYDSLLKLLFAAIAVVIIAAIVDWLVPSLRVFLAKLITPTAIALTAIGVAAVTWAYFVRPRPLSELPSSDGVPVTKELTRAINAWHRTQTMHWLGDWFGPLTLAVALVGLILLGWWALRGNTAAIAIVLLSLPLTAVFLLRPSITPDHPWAMRRFLPFTIPAIAIGLAVVGRILWAKSREISNATGRAVAVGGIVVVGAVLIAPSANAARPLLEARNQYGALGAVHDLCRSAGPDAAMIVLGTDYIDLEWPQSVRGFCGIPAARPNPKRPNPDVAELARASEQAGRTLFVLTADPELVAKIPGVTATERTHVVVEDEYAPEQTFDGRSERLEAPRFREAWLFEIDPFPQPLPAAASPSG